MATTTVTATYLNPEGSPCQGRVTFRLVAATYQETVDAIYPTVPVSGVLDASGEISVELEPTSGDDAAFDSDTMTYQVVERINGTRRDAYYVDIPTAPAVDLGTLATYDDPPAIARQLVVPDLSTLGYVTTEEADDQFVHTINATAYGAVGDGVTDDTAALQAAIDALDGRPGTVSFPDLVFGITGPLVTGDGQTLTSGGHRDALAGAVIKALAGFTGDAMIQSVSWTEDGWWHTASLENLTLDCNSVASAGVAIHQMGEESLIRRVRVRYPTGTAGFLLTGAHAPATLESVRCDASAGYGIKLTTHATFTGNAGVVRILGFSGDDNATGMLYSDGSHAITALGVKQEGASTYAYQFAGSGICTLYATGYSNLDAGSAMVRIDGTARPVITLAAYRWAGVTNIIDDQVIPRTVTAASMTYFPALLTHNGYQLFGGQEVVMGQGNALKWRRNDNASLVSVLDQPSDLTVRLKSVSGPGIRFDDSSGNSIATFTSSAHTLLKATTMSGARFTRALVASTLSSPGAVSCDADLGNEFDVTLQANCSGVTIGNGAAGQVVTVTLIQDATGGRTYVWGSALKFAGGAAPSDTTLSTRTTVTFRKSGSNWYETARAVAVAA